MSSFFALCLFLLRRAVFSKNLASGCPRNDLMAASHTTPLGRSPPRPGRDLFNPVVSSSSCSFGPRLSTSSGGRSTASAPPARAMRSRFGGKMEYDDLRRRKDVTRKPQPAVQPRLRSRGRVFLFFLIALWVSPHARAKMNIDFNPDLDFSKFKTFAYIGGVEHLVMLQLNPNEIRDRVHEAVARELTKRGLKEVKRQDNPDLVVRYFANSQSEVNVAATGDWGGFDPFILDNWSYTYELWSATTTREGSLMIDLIDVKRKDLAWRLFLEQKIPNIDKAWPKVNQEITKGFESSPPTEKEREEKRKERAEHPPKKQKPQFQ